MRDPTRSATLSRTRSGPPRRARTGQLSACSTTTKQSGTLPFDSDSERDYSPRFQMPHPRNPDSSSLVKQRSVLLVIEDLTNARKSSADDPDTFEARSNLGPVARRSRVLKKSWKSPSSRWP